MTEVTRGFCWYQSFVPWGCLPQTCGCIHLLNHEKRCIRSEVEESLFKLATNDHSDEAFLLTSTIVLCLNFFSSIIADFNICSALRWMIQDQWSSGFVFCRLEMGKTSKSRSDGTTRGEGDSAVSQVQQILRERLSQCGRPPEICGYKQERR